MGDERTVIIGGGGNIINSMQNMIATLQQGSGPLTQAEVLLVNTTLAAVTEEQQTISEAVKASDP